MNIREYKIPLNILKMLIFSLNLKTENQEKIKAFKAKVKAYNKDKDNKRRIKLKEGNKDLSALNIKIIFINPLLFIGNIIISNIYRDYY